MFNRLLDQVKKGQKLPIIPESYKEKDYTNVNYNDLSLEEAFYAKLQDLPEYTDLSRLKHIINQVNNQQVKTTAEIKNTKEELGKELKKIINSYREE